MILRIRGKRMYNVTVIIGVRPHYVKANGLNEIFKNTEINPIFFDVCQHYDQYLHDNYLDFCGFEIRNVYRKRANRSHDFADQIIDVEDWLDSSEGKKSKAVIVLGDANPAMSGAIAANKKGFPIIHIEAGVRRIETEKEHWNSIVADHLSNLRYCYTRKSMENLEYEGLKNNSYMVGDILAEWTIKKAEQIKNMPSKNPYCLVSIHRPQNCNMESISELCKALKGFNKEVIWILHLRTKKFNEQIKKELNAHVILSQKHEEALKLLKYADLIITDSGGFVREGTLLKKPIIVCHEQGMWAELVENNIIMRADMTHTSLTYAINNYSKLNYKNGKYFFIAENGKQMFLKTISDFLQRM